MRNRRRIRYGARVTQGKRDASMVASAEKPKACDEPGDRRGGRRARSARAAAETVQRGDGTLPRLIPTSLIESHMKEAQAKAWDSLARYKFQMFGYWAAIWVHLNRISGLKRRNPFRGVVSVARIEKRTQWL